MTNKFQSKHPFWELAKGKRIVYVATRLYEYYEKLATVQLEAAVLAGLSDASKSLQIPIEKFPTFMPFRDTVENIEEMDKLIEKEHKAYKIYEDDCNRLARLFALVTYLNDPCKDDGVCMEIGFAFARKVPTLIILTDFIHYSSIANPEIEYSLDPILIRMAGHIMQHNELSPANVRFPSDRNYLDMQRVARDFEKRLNQENQKLLVKVREHVQRLAIDPQSFTADHPTELESYNNQRGYIVFIDFSGGLFEWGREYAQRLAVSLLNLGMVVHIGCRHNPDIHAEVNEGNVNKTSAYVLGNTDLVAALSSDVLVLSSDGMEVDGGTAALQGAARALNKKVILYYSGNIQTNAQGRAPTSRNLMLLYSADLIATRLDEIPDMIRNLLNSGERY